MGRDAMSVVDNSLKVYGIDNLRIADGSIMPRVTTGNTMAPRVIIGERAGRSVPSRTSPMSLMKLISCDVSPVQTLLVTPF